MKKIMFNFLKRKEKIITRIAPSPTGVLHIGTARTALFNYLFAKQNDGKFILRIEDTDKERSKREFEEDIINSLEWLGLNYDEIYHQSERTEIYRKYLQKLIDDDKAYISKEEKGERDSVIRFRNPKKEIVFDDLIRGKIKFDTTELGDFVIAKSINEPLYHLAVVVDDHEMNITHILRGEDGISNTPRQILIQEAIGANRPKYGHLPLILGPDKSKLSKRHGATSLSEFKKAGYLKNALINYLALLGWNPGTEQEIFSQKELIEKFDLRKINKGGAVFNIEKLDWFNKKHWLEVSPNTAEVEIKQELGKIGIKEQLAQKLLPIVKERINKLSDIEKLKSEGEFDYYTDKPEYDAQNLIWKKSDKDSTKGHLQKIKKLISDNSEKEKADEIKGILWDYAEKEGRGDVLWPMRYALSGKEKSPDPFTLSAILGKEETLKRINSAIEKITDA